MSDLVVADPVVASEYRARGWWGDDTLARCVSRNAAARPDGPAFVEAERRLTWRRYEDLTSSLAGALAAAGLERGDRLGVLLPDGPTVHVVYVAAEKAGITVVGIGARAGRSEIRHILAKTGARALLTHEHHRGEPMGDVFAAVTDGLAVQDHLVVPDLGAPGAAAELRRDTRRVDGPGGAARAGATRGPSLGPDELFMINSTSGTTGLPKCVMHTQNRWFYFHDLAVEAGDLTSGDVFMSVIPAPFGFGLWTAHFTPTILGAPTVLMERFSPEAALRLIEEERVTVLMCVSTQFIMLLNSPASERADLSSLRVMFTGGEAVPYERAARFEERTGAAVLQFFGSNETGALSRTTTRDGRERRLRTAGRVIDDMQVRLYDDQGRDVTGRGVAGRPACRGPATCLGYLDDEQANAQLLTADGWMLMGDIAEIDADGYLRVIGRTSDFIIRGGKNISAPAVEEEVSTHPAVALAAAVPIPDPVFGERVCVYAELHDGMSLALPELVAHLDARGVSKEWFPEQLVVLPELPRSSGGKVAKGELRADARRRAAAGDS